uniref:Uncharacterized protein n=1 Tax=Anguilla anguilla TaxID=7936 RepID=A0A0E9V9C9_ANGAN
MLFIPVQCLLGLDFIVQPLFYADCLTTRGLLTGFP